MGPFSVSKGSGMNEKFYVSKMGVKIAASVYMGKDFLDVQHEQKHWK